MKALILRKTGEPHSVLKLAEIPTPPLAPGEALVRVLLSPINLSDLHMVRGRYGYQPELPASPGAEGVGIVEAVGPGVQGPIVGTRVVFVHTWNTWSDRWRTQNQAVTCAVIGNRWLHWAELGSVCAKSLLSPPTP